jgi:hypothetical protein
LSLCHLSDWNLPLHKNIIHGGCKNGHWCNKCRYFSTEVNLTITKRMTY